MHYIIRAGLSSVICTGLTDQTAMTLYDEGCDIYRITEHGAEKLYEGGEWTPLPEFAPFPISITDVLCAGV